jgi:predicted enzyme related to lactoylglutathione lyase
MPQFTQHLPGTFSWPELSTTDQKGAVAFYRAIFGWGVNEVPIGPNDLYSLFQLNGGDVAAGYTMREDERKVGIPPHWNNYVTVDNVDAATARAKELGATVLAPPFDVMDSGRMSVLRDPTGAVFQLWQAGRSIGAQTLGEPGALVWTELMTDDTAKAEKFYTALLGWVPKHSGPGSPMPYTEFTVKGAQRPSVGLLGRLPHMPKDVPPFWMPYFQVADVDATTAKARAAGGTVHVEPQDIPSTGRFAVLVDPQGAAFAVFQPGPSRQ